jgi:predicted nucleic acid-binding Zn ribbon protein
MTYLYETIPAKEGDAVCQFEYKQSMNDQPLTQHPETGEPVRRIILGGYGLMTGKSSSSMASSQSSGGHCCGSGRCCN